MREKLLNSINVVYRGYYQGLYDDKREQEAEFHPDFWQCIIDTLEAEGIEFGADKRHLIGPGLEAFRMPAYGSNTFMLRTSTSTFEKYQSVITHLAKVAYTPKATWHRILVRLKPDYQLVYNLFRVSELLSGDGIRIHREAPNYFEYGDFFFTIERP